MSIIEKAAGKIGAGTSRPVSPVDNNHPGNDSSLIENALNKQRGGHARQTNE